MTPEEKQKKISILWWVLNTRWITVTSVLAAIGFVDWTIGSSLLTSISQIVIIGLPLYFYAFSGVFLWLLRPGNRVAISPRLVMLIGESIIPLDFVLFFFALWFTGGIGSGFILIYFFPIFLSSVLYEQPLKVIAVGLTSVISLWLEHLLEILDVLPHHWLISPLADLAFENIAAAVTFLALASAIFLGLSAAATFINRGIREAQLSAETERQKLGSIVRDLRDGIILIDSQDTIVLFNAAAENIFRISAVEVVGKKISDFPENSRLGEGLRIVAPLPDGRHWSFFEQDRPLYFLITDISIPTWQGFLGKIKVLHDVTREEELSRLKSRFISVAAHQLRTPLSIVKWALSMLSSDEEKRLTVEQLDLVQKSLTANERMIRLINDLLDVARIEEGRFGYSFARTDLVALVERLSETLGLQAERKGLSFSVQKPEQPIPLLMLDADRISIAIQNIVENAVSYTLKGGVEVRFKRDGVDVRVIITDTGIGVPEHQLANLFTRFFRGDNAVKLQIDGTGLGLFIARNIVRRHGGYITFASQENKGTVVTISLPIDPSRIPQAEIPIEEVLG